MAISQNICVIFLVAAICLQGAFTMPSNIATESSTGATEAPSNFTCPENGNIEPAYYPHPVKCEQYYSCSMPNGYVPILLHCPGQQLFSLQYRGCDVPEQTHCGDRERPEGYPPTNSPPGQTTPTPFPCPGNEPDVSYADPDDCKSYWRCIYGTSYHYTCADPLYFNDVTKACDWKDNVDCGTRP